MGPRSQDKPYESKELMEWAMWVNTHWALDLETVMVTYQFIKLQMHPYNLLGRDLHKLWAGFQFLETDVKYDVWRDASGQGASGGKRWTFKVWPLQGDLILSLSYYKGSFLSSGLRNNHQSL